jgi:MoxR-vWA-beta-propeller ternary system domain bpX2
MTKISSLLDVCCASLTPQCLGAVAGFRSAPGVQVALHGGLAWVRWEPHQDYILQALLPVRGVQLYVQRDGLWYRHGGHLPAFDLPEQADYRPLYRAVTPVPVKPVPPLLPNLRPMTLSVVPDTTAQPPTAVRCRVKDVVKWADKLASTRLSGIRASWFEGGVVLLGPRLPAPIDGQRFWGETVLVPLGHRPEPNLCASAIREALAIAQGELLLLSTAGAEVISLSAFQPLTRASIRMGLENVVA